MNVLGSFLKPFIQIMHDICSQFTPPPIQDVVFPQQFLPGKSSRFFVLCLNDGSIGLAYLMFVPGPSLAKLTQIGHQIIGKSPQLYFDGLNSSDPLSQVIAMGCINAVSQSFFKTFHIPLDYTIDSLGLLDINPKDHVGMVGFFPPLVAQIENIGAKLTVIEKRDDLVDLNLHWEVTLDPKKLRPCNKIICTPTTILNDTVEQILQECHNAHHISVVGPTGGFIPDLLFEKGVDVIGSGMVQDFNEFLYRIRNNLPWESTYRKYCIQKNKYKGYREYLRFNMNLSK